MKLCNNKKEIEKIQIRNVPVYILMFVIMYVWPKSTVQKGSFIIGDIVQLSPKVRDLKQRNEN